MSEEKLYPLPVNHELKTDPDVFDEVARGEKTFEIRYNDRNFQIGDRLTLRRTDFTGEEMKAGKPPCLHGNRCAYSRYRHICFKRPNLRSGRRLGYSFIREATYNQRNHRGRGSRGRCLAKYRCVSRFLDAFMCGNCWKIRGRNYFSFRSSRRLPRLQGEGQGD